MLGRPNASEAVRKRLRLAVLDPKDGSKLLAVLTREDTDWVLENALELAGANPLNPGIIMANLDPSRRPEFVGTFSREPVETRHSIRSAIERKVHDPAELKALLQLVR
jgi:hypothetical protein